MLWEAGVQAKEIVDKLDVPLSSIYSELRRGQETEADCRTRGFATMQTLPS